MVVVWLTVVGGAILGLTYAGFGGFRAVGPDSVPRPAAAGPDRPRRTTSFTAAQVVIHAMLGILTALLVTYGASLRDDRTPGYIALIMALLLTGIPGVAMFTKWRSGERPTRTLDADRSEDHLPRLVVYLHGLGATATLLIIVVLLLAD